MLSDCGELGQDATRCALVCARRSTATFPFIEQVSGTCVACRAQSTFVAAGHAFGAHRSTLRVHGPRLRTWDYRTGNLLLGVCPVGAQYGSVPLYHGSMDGITVETRPLHLPSAHSAPPFSCTFHGWIIDYSHGTRPMENAVGLRRVGTGCYSLCFGLCAAVNCYLPIY